MLFFTPEYDIPAGVGFTLYGPEHLGALGVLFVLSLGVLLWLRGRTVSLQNRVLRAMSIAMILMELLKDFTLGVIGAFSIGYLPLHLCSMAMFVCLYYAFHPESDACGQLLYSVCLPGALCALLFPDWTRFPLWHFQSLHSFLYHAMLVQFSLFPVISRRVRPSLRQVPRSFLFLCIVALPVGLLNHLLGTNYMFLSRPSKGSPLEFLSVLPGKYGYLLGYCLLVLGVLFLMELPFSLYRRIQQRQTGSA
jgi:hypothetical integral membrane protein (TIGR02206 family)